MRKLCSLVLVVSMMVVGTPAVAGLDYNVTVGEDSMHLGVDVTVNLDVEVVYERIVSWLENIGISPENIPSLDEVAAKIENRLEAVENLRRDHEAEVESAMKEISQERLREFVPGVVVENVDLSFEASRDNYTLTTTASLSFDLSGENLFRVTSTGQRRINFRWRAFVLRRAKVVGDRLFNPRWMFINLSGFKAPLDQWTRTEENGRLKLSHTTDYEVTLPDYEVAMTIDPTATFLGPEGSAGATVTGDEVVLALPTQPFGILPPLWVAVVAAIAIVVAILLMIWKYMSRGVRVTATH